MEEVVAAPSTSYDRLSCAWDTYYALKSQRPKQQPFLVRLIDLRDTGTERVLVDRNAIDPSTAGGLSRVAR